MLFLSFFFFLISNQTNFQISQLLKKAKDKRLYETLKVATSLYEGGNMVAQESLMKYLNFSDPHNRFFSNLFQLISNLERELKHEQMLIQNQSNTYAIDQTHPDVIEQVFKFLQLLCEGPHHVKDSIVYKLQVCLKFQLVPVFLNFLFFEKRMS